MRLKKISILLVIIVFLGAFSLAVVAGEGSVPNEATIVTPMDTTISEGESEVSVVVELFANSDVSNTFAEEATDLSNWIIDENDTGLSASNIVKNSDTQVTINFEGEAIKPRAINIQAKADAVVGEYDIPSNKLTFSVVDDGYVESSNPNLRTYYTKNTDVDGDMKGLVVIVHGLAEHLGRYNYVTEQLNQSGYGVYRLDNKGHGKTEKTIINNETVEGYVEDFNEYLDDPNIIVDMAKKDYPDKKVFMLGHSMGARIVSAYGIKYPEQLDGQIFTSGALRFQEDFVKYRDSEEESPFEGDKATEMIDNQLTDAISRDFAIRAQYAVDPFNLSQFANKLLQEYRVGLGGYIKDYIEEYEYPSLILHGGDDKIVPKGVSEWFYDSIKSQDKELKIYPEAYHEILNEREEKYEVYEDILDWMDERI